MRAYEMMLVFKPDLEEEVRKEGLDRLKAAIETDGKVGEVEDMGKRKLAYEINYIKEGYYYLMHFEAAPTVITELERRARINDRIMRYLTVKKED